MTKKPIFFQPNPQEAVIGVFWNEYPNYRPRHCTRYFRVAIVGRSEVGEHFIRQLNRPIHLIELKLSFGRIFNPPVRSACESRLRKRTS